ncbi:MAG: 2Fe-2S iron-sulfur cluster-binding protein [Microbacterium sp.]|uniref:2Fe-2S iron-sulfur cluster-binding protein n=1 Tax=Microbacterium sp. TaxID=51671 RepID=UPI002721912D|nr:2Fe-2S iron-sulfur cluster-binding protein [Microbacterium sp.]MDO8382403.1 2Fe-2S iron-sulfur cluster-binding protein [Microbacterium sp.]
MPKVVFIVNDQDRREIEMPVGETVMSAAVRSGVPGIIGECGGQLSCATCHVWVSDSDRERVGGPGEVESDLLDLGVTDFSEASRLGCQITITDELDGLVVEPRPEAWH